MGVKKKKMKRGAWTPLEDKVLMDYVKVHGKGKWANISRETGLKGCGRNCRQRGLNDLSHDNKRGNITADEEELIIRLYKLLGNRWSLIAGRLPGRTDNEIKNYWYSTLREKIQSKTTEKQLISEMSEEADATSKMDSSSCCDSPAAKHVELE